MVILKHDCDIERLDDPSATHGPFRDSHFNDFLPDTNPGAGATFIHIGIDADAGKGNEIEWRGILRFDLHAFLPADANPTFAEWWFYVVSTDALSGHLFRLSRCIKYITGPTTWVEDEVTWNEFRNSFSWTTPGGDIDTPTRQFDSLDTTGWHNEAITSLVTDAWDTRDGICTFIMHRISDLGVQGEISIASKEVYDSPTPAIRARAHHLRITYTLEGKTFEVMIH